MTKVQKENEELRSIVKEIKTENMELKARLNQIENKLLENNFVILGVSENPWESESELREKVYTLSIRKTLQSNCKLPKRLSEKDW